VLFSSEKGAAETAKKGAEAPEQCFAKRRRNGASIRARTEESSTARVRIPTRQKAPRSVRRHHPSRDGVRGGPWLTRRTAKSPDFVANRAGDPGARGTTRRTSAVSFDNTRHVFARMSRLATCPDHVSGARRTQVVVNRLRLAGHPYGNVSVGQRNRHRLVPVSSGAKAPLACEDRTLVRVCPRVVSRLQKSASDAQVQRSVSPGGKRGAWTGA